MEFRHPLVAPNIRGNSFAIKWKATAQYFTRTKLGILASFTGVSIMERALLSSHMHQRIRVKLAVVKERAMRVSGSVENEKVKDFRRILTAPGSEDTSRMTRSKEKLK